MKPIIESQITALQLEKGISRDDVIYVDVGSALYAQLETECKVAPNTIMPTLTFAEDLFVFKNKELPDWSMCIFDSNGEETVIPLDHLIDRSETTYA